ncbi:MAG: PGPGW domain-containing protein [Rhodospirillaceae bacterium]
MPKPLKRVLILTTGWFFVVLGILGIFLPILQGLLFLTIGLILLSRESAWMQDKLDRAKRKWPAFGEKYDMAEERAERLWRRLSGNGNAG